MDGGKVTALVLLDLSAAFDSVHHSILLHRLENWFGISGPALDWFSTYLCPRTQSVYLNGNYSSDALLTCGVPQGSVLGPLLFTLYTTPLGALLDNHSLRYHLMILKCTFHLTVCHVTHLYSCCLLSLMRYSPGWHPINSSSPP